VDADYCACFLTGLLVRNAGSPPPLLVCRAAVIIIVSHMPGEGTAYRPHAKTE